MLDEWTYLGVNKGMDMTAYQKSLSQIGSKAMSKSTSANVLLGGLS